MQTEANTPQPGWLRRLGAAGPVAIVLSFAPPLGGFLLLAALTWLGGWLRLHGAAGWLIYVVSATVLVGISFIPTFSCGILAGWAFGFLVGWGLSVVSVVAGSLVAYAVGRGIARDRVLALVAEKPKLRVIHEALLARHAGQTLLVVTLLRIPPASPFALANFLLAAMRVPLADYTLGTFVGIIPRMALTAFVGAGLDQLRFKNVLDTWMVVTGMIAAVIVCVALGVLANRALRQIAGNSQREALAAAEGRAVSRS